MEYFLPAGRLWLQLDRDKSGGAVHETWRLRFEPGQETTLQEVIQPEVLTCADELLRASFGLVVLNRETHVPRVSVSVDGGKVRKLTWMNLAK